MFNLCDKDRDIQLMAMMMQKRVRMRRIVIVGMLLRMMLIVVMLERMMLMIVGMLVRMMVMIVGILVRIVVMIVGMLLRIVVITSREPEGATILIQLGTWPDRFVSTAEHNDDDDERTRTSRNVGTLYQKWEHWTLRCIDTVVALKRL